MEAIENIKDTQTFDKIFSRNRNLGKRLRKAKKHQASDEDDGKDDNQFE